MSPGKLTRREFMTTTSVAPAGLAVAAAVNGRGRIIVPPRLHVACNEYPWSMFYLRETRNFQASLDAGLGEVAKSGMDGFEPAINSPKDVEKYAPLLKNHGLEMRSLYVNSLLHKPDQVEGSISGILAIAEKARTTGTRIIVTNPSPIQWGGPENKTDAQLRVQAAALEDLGDKLKSLGMTLSYHNHDIELRNAAREFHHMMAGTDPKRVTLCLDCHWIYRGSGNSAIALFDVMKLYGSRISELHLRQSRGNVWSETLGEGDIDYPAVANYLQSIRVKPHVVLEQAPEKGTPKTMDAIESHRQSREYVDRVFSAFV